MTVWSRPFQTHAQSFITLRIMPSSIKLLKVSIKFEFIGLYECLLSNQSLYLLMYFCLIYYIISQIFHIFEDQKSSTKILAEKGLLDILTREGSGQSSPSPSCDITQYLLIFLICDYLCSYFLCLQKIEILTDMQMYLRVNIFTNSSTKNRKHQR